MQGLPSGPETRTFAEELLAKIPGSAGARPGAAKGAMTYQQREREAAAIARKNAAFALLSDDEDDDFDAAAAPAPTTAPLPKQAAQRKSLRKAKARPGLPVGPGRGCAICVLLSASGRCSQGNQLAFCARQGVPAPLVTAACCSRHSSFAAS